MLYWLEVPSSKNFLGVAFGAGETTRWAAFVNSTMYGPGQLSVENEAPVQWVPNFGKFAGDYDVGAFFHLDIGRPAVFFLAQWPQSDEPAPAAPNGYLHYNIMAIESLR